MRLLAFFLLFHSLVYDTAFCPRPSWKYFSPELSSVPSVVILSPDGRLPRDVFGYLIPGALAKTDLSDAQCLLRQGGRRRKAAAMCDILKHKLPGCWFGVGAPWPKADRQMEEPRVIGSHFTEGGG